MRRLLGGAVAIILAVIVLALPAASLATGNEGVDGTPVKRAANIVTSKMRLSERQLNSIVNEKDVLVRATLFTEFVNSRLKYATVRSLAKATGNSWLGYVDIAEELDNGEHVGYVLDQAVVQYSYQNLPAGTIECTLTIGEYSDFIVYDRQVLFSFDEADLDEDAAEEDVELSVEYRGRLLNIELTEHYPNETLDRDAALARMTEAYVKSVEKSGKVKPVDHALLRLKSYISDYETQTRSYTWELYLVHGAELPADATLIRLYEDTGTTMVYDRTLKTYF